jgi:uncharacterized protein YutE (UPF0331/DUF86 family)
MGWLQFLSSVIGNVAWPITVMVAFFVLKKHVAALSTFIERLKYKDFEVEFRKSVHELTEQSRTVLAVPENDEQDAIGKNRLYELAEISPRSAILEAWLQVEAAAADAIRTRAPELGSKMPSSSPLRLGEQLNRREIINGKQLEIFHRLRALRNKAVHVGDVIFQLDEVLEYIALATSLASQIRKGNNGP